MKKITLTNGQTKALYFVGGGVAALVGERLISRAIEAIPFRFAGFKVEDVLSDLDDFIDDDDEDNN